MNSLKFLKKGRVMRLIILVDMIWVFEEDAKEESAEIGVNGPLLLSVFFLVDGEQFIHMGL